MRLNSFVNSWVTIKEIQRVRETVTISAPSRLHFGLFSIGNLAASQFGGLGLMIDSPRTEVTVSPTDRFEVVEGPGSQACLAAIESWFGALSDSSGADFLDRSLEHLPVKVEVVQLPPRHSGFGSGTQLAFASALALTRYFRLATPGPEELAAMVGRGKRSGIGTYGFFQGGLLVDRGKTDSQQLAPLDFQTDFPEPWRIVTVMLKDESGLFGQKEMDAFGNLPSTPKKDQEEMIEIVRSQIIPGVLGRDFELFSESLYQFGRKSGMMYAEIQQGPYNGPRIAALIAKIRQFGIRGVGQSSWGPCVFAITPTEAVAEDLVESLQAEYGNLGSVQITQADNQGARTLPCNSLDLNR